jgi:hypothetical protein
MIDPETLKKLALSLGIDQKQFEDNLKADPDFATKLANVIAPKPGQPVKPGQPAVPAPAKPSGMTPMSKPMIVGTTPVTEAKKRIKRLVEELEAAGADTDVSAKMKELEALVKSVDTKVGSINTRLSNIEAGESTDDLATGDDLGGDPVDPSADPTGGDSALNTLTGGDQDFGQDDDGLDGDEADAHLDSMLDDQTNPDGGLDADGQANAAAPTPTPNKSFGESVLAEFTDCSDEDFDDVINESYKRHTVGDRRWGNDWKF